MPSLRSSAQPIKSRALLLALAFAALASAAENWPQFRGPGGRGVSAVAAPTAWRVEPREHVRWVAEIPGLAHASPIIWGDQIFLTTVDRPGPRPTVKTGVYGSGDSDLERVAHEWRRSEEHTSELQSH